MTFFSSSTVYIIEGIRYRVSEEYDGKVRFQLSHSLPTQVVYIRSLSEKLVSVIKQRDCIYLASIL